jgi:hypothetical protein
LDINQTKPLTEMLISLYQRINCSAYIINQSDKNSKGNNDYFAMKANGFFPIPALMKQTEIIIKAIIGEVFDEQAVQKSMISGPRQERRYSF